MTGFRCSGCHVLGASHADDAVLERLLAVCTSAWQDEAGTGPGEPEGDEGDGEHGRRDRGCPR